MSKEHEAVLQALRTASLAAEQGHRELPELRQLCRLRWRLQHLLANERLGSDGTSRPEPAGAQGEATAAPGSPPA